MRPRCPEERALLEQNGIEIRESVTRVVIDGNAPVEKADARHAIALADVIVVPILPSLTDRDATRRLLDRIARLERVRRGRRAIAFVANRHRRRTRATAEQEWPVLGRLRDARRYTTAADTGLSILELCERRAR